MTITKTDLDALRVEAERIAALDYRGFSDADFYVMRNPILGRPVAVTNRDDVQPLGRLLEAAPAMASLIRRQQAAIQELVAAVSEFKNFHRLLCERFDYCHDEIDWKRDQLSLIEHIARAAIASQEQTK